MPDPAASGIGAAVGGNVGATPSGDSSRLHRADCSIYPRATGRHMARESLSPDSMLYRRGLLIAMVALLGCGARPSVLPHGDDWHAAVIDRSGAPQLAWALSVCPRAELRPESRALDEESLLSFLKAEGLSARAQREPVEPGRPPLVFIFVEETRAPLNAVPLRVAILPSADAAGRALDEALQERGDGAWGLRRSNLAILGPPADPHDAIAFVARSNLACWGTFMFRESGATVVMPGAYLEP